MSTVKVNTSDINWIKRNADESQTVAYGTDIKGVMYFQVEVKVGRVEHVTFAGTKMIRFDLFLDAPNDGNRHAMYPESYLVRA